MTPKKWDKESIQALLTKREDAVIRALLVLYGRQTTEEQRGKHTTEVNGRGFNQHDAPFLTEMVRSLQQWGRLTPKQMAVTRNKVKRYWRQLAEVANAKQQPEQIVVQPAVSPEMPIARPMGECTCENYDGEMLCPECQIRAGQHPDIADSNAAGFAERKAEQLAHWGSW
jgi:hypothetical protein